MDNWPHHSLYYGRRMFKTKTFNSSTVKKVNDVLFLKQIFFL